jgi:3-oxoacyl-[acyl-carrier-protein] synthase-3
MNGAEIFEFTLRVVPQTVEELLAKAGRTAESIDFWVFHQANHYMLKHLRDKLGLPHEKFIISMANCGNTVSSTIPIALKELQAAGRLLDGQTLMLVGFGVGYSWAGSLVRWRGETATSQPAT